MGASRSRRRRAQRRGGEGGWRLGGEARGRGRAAIPAGGCLCSWSDPACSGLWLARLGCERRVAGSGAGAREARGAGSPRPQRRGGPPVRPVLRCATRRGRIRHSGAAAWCEWGGKQSRAGGVRRCCAAVIWARGGAPASSKVSEGKNRGQESIDLSSNNGSKNS